MGILLRARGLWRFGRVSCALTHDVRGRTSALISHKQRLGCFCVFCRHLTSSRQGPARRAARPRGTAGCGASRKAESSNSPTWNAPPSTKLSLVAATSHLGAGVPLGAAEAYACRRRSTPQEAPRRSSGRRVELVLEATTTEFVMLRVSAIVVEKRDRTELDPPTSEASAQSPVVSVGIALDPRRTSHWREETRWRPRSKRVAADYRCAAAPAAWGLTNWEEGSTRQPVSPVTIVDGGAITLFDGRWWRSGPALRMRVGGVGSRDSPERAAEAGRRPPAGLGASCRGRG